MLFLFQRDEVELYKCGCGAEGEGMPTRCPKCGAKAEATVYAGEIFDRTGKAIPIEEAMFGAKPDNARNSARQDSQMLKALLKRWSVVDLIAWLDEELLSQSDEAASEGNHKAEKRMLRESAILRETIERLIEARQNRK